jgi:hypothetical protein
MYACNLNISRYKEDIMKIYLMFNEIGSNVIRFNNGNIISHDEETYIVKYDNGGNDVIYKKYSAGIDNDGIIFESSGFTDGYPDPEKKVLCGIIIYEEDETADEVLRIFTEKFKDKIDKIANYA